MGSVASNQLTIQHDHPKKLGKVAVAGKLHFTEYEVNEMKEGLKFKVRCELWGADGGLFGSDDKLFTFTPKYFPDSSPAMAEDVKFEVTVGEGVLDEDLGRDEVYAKLILTNLYTTISHTKKSNVVRHSF